MDTSTENGVIRPVRISYTKPDPAARKAARQAGAKAAKEAAERAKAERKAAKEAAAARRAAPRKDVGETAGTGSRSRATLNDEQIGAILRSSMPWVAKALEEAYRMGAESAGESR